MTENKFPTWHTKDTVDYLKVEDLKEGYLYRIMARNADYGVWFASEDGFVIRRLKFNDVFTFTELHWDLSDHFGTAKPLMELEASPFTKEDLVYKTEDYKMWRPREAELLEWLRHRSQYWEKLI